MERVVIVSGVRTPIGKYGGSYKDIPVYKLASLVLDEAVKKARVDPGLVDDVIMGQAYQNGECANGARMALLEAGWPDTVPGMVIDRRCCSGLDAISIGVMKIQTGNAEIVVAGGMENMSMAPFFLEKARFGYRMGPGKLQDHMMHDGLWDNVNDFHMGMSNELCSERYGVSREDQDRYAAESYRRSINAVTSGRFKDEIVPVEIAGKKGMTIFDRDECPQETSYEALSKMKPAFKKDGVGTAGNASIISDGAAAVVVMSKEKAEALGCKIMARIGAQASYAIDMKYVLVAPIWAIPKCLKKEGLSKEDIGLYEINEAFSGSTVAVLRELGLNPSNVNVNGGSVALGHPIGASGCRVLVTLLYEMIRQDKKTGLASLCLGGGEAVAMIVKR